MTPAFVAGLVLAAANAHPLDLPKSATQGALVIGHAAAGAQADLDGRRLRVGADGTFVFGLDRDAGPSVDVRVRYADGTNVTRKLSVTKRSWRIEKVDGLPQHTVTPDPATAKRIAEEQGRVALARERDDAREDFRGGFARPGAGRVSGVYGSQRIDNGVPKSPHYGLDLALPTGTPVHAPAPGIVTFAETDLVLTGGTVLVDHGFGLTSSFLHLSRIDVHPGDRIERGQVLGAVGATGRASGPHLHWGFNWFEKRLDPELLPKPSR